MSEGNLPHPSKRGKRREGKGEGAARFKKSGIPKERSLEILNNFKGKDYNNARIVFFIYYKSKIPK